MKDKFVFTIDYKKEWYLFDQVFNDGSAIFNDPNKGDFIIRLDVETKTPGNNIIWARLPLQNCSNYMDIINILKDNFAKLELSASLPKVLYILKNILTKNKDNI